MMHICQKIWFENGSHRKNQGNPKICRNHLRSMNVLPVALELSRSLTKVLDGPVTSISPAKETVGFVQSAVLSIVMLASLTDRAKAGTYRFSASGTWGCSRTSPPWPWNEAFPHWEVSPHLNPCTINTQIHNTGEYSIRDSVISRHMVAFFLWVPNGRLWSALHFCEALYVSLFALLQFF